MDYEKKYNGALERAIKFYTPDSNNSNLKAVLELIFPELTESEDERMRKMVIGYLKLDAEEYPEREERINKMIAYLEKQKEQKPAEWSEEDERVLKGIIGLVDHDQHYGVSNKEMISWLKSLRPQPHWEPSDEQLRPLEYAIDYFKKKKNDTTYLESLYNDLKIL